MQLVLILMVATAMSMRGFIAPTSRPGDVTVLAELAGVMTVAGIGGSVFVAAAQGLVVRTHFPAGRFFVATVIGWGLASGAYMPTARAMYAVWTAIGVARPVLGPMVGDFTNWSILFATSGALLGIAQWWVLRLWVRHAWLWIAASIVGALVAYAVYVLAHFLLVMLVYLPAMGAPRPSASSIISRGTLTSLGIAACCCLGYGAVTGAVLTWLVGRGRTDGPASEAPGVDSASSDVSDGRHNTLEK